MFYVTLGNRGFCTPDDADPSFCIEQPDYGLSNTGPFSDIQPIFYWSSSEFDSSKAWTFGFSTGGQDNDGKNNSGFAWAVRSGDVPATVVPLPPAIWLFGSGMLGLIGIAGPKKAA